MKSILITFLIVVGLTASSFGASRSDEFDALKYGDDVYNDWREITYWGIVSLSVADYEYGSRDAEFLKLVVKDKADRFSESPRDDVQKHFLTEFKRLFGDLPFRDMNEGKNQRLEQFRRENPQWDYTKSTVDIVNAFNAFYAAELARRNALYGGRAGAVYCHVRVKRRTFPVLYDIRCSLSANDDLSYSSWREGTDMGFSTPEHIDKEIRQAITRMLETENAEFRKAKKYGKRTQ